jgi:hypothetical protein
VTLRARLSLFLAFALAAGASAGAEHQRVGVEAETRGRVEAGLACSWRPLSSGFSSLVSGSVEYSWRDMVAVAVCLPILFDRDESVYREPWTSSWGDPVASLSYLWRGEARRVSAALAYSFPAYGEPRRGFHSLTPSLGLALVRDPVILSIGLEAKLCLPGERAGYLLWRPVSYGLDLSAWELLNDRVSCQVSISPSLSFGTLRLGSGDRALPAWSLALSLTLAWDERNWGLSAGWGRSTGSGGGSSDGELRLRGALRKEW